jgi:hypothetical protein
MPGQEEFKDLHFPKAGLNVVSAFSAQPNRPVGPAKEYARTAPVLVNARGYDPVQNRFRGGARSGLSKPSNLPRKQVNGVSFVVQDLSCFSTIGTDPQASLRALAVSEYKLDGNLFDSSGSARNLNPDRPPDPVYGAGIINQALTNGAGYIHPLPGIVDNAISVSGWFFTTTATGNGGGTGFGRGTETGEGFRLAYRSDSAHGDIVLRDRTGTNVIDPGLTLTLGQWVFACFTYDTTTHSPGLATLYINGASVGTFSHTLTAGWSGLSFGINTVGADFTSPLDEVCVFSRALSAGEVATLHTQQAAGNTLFGTNVELNQSGRTVQVVAVSQGVVKVAQPGDTDWTVPTNNTGETPPVNFTGVMQSAANQQKLFIVDGINYVYYDPTTNSTELWQNHITAGQLPKDVDNNFARLICTWRGRTVLSGVLKNPNDIFMSAIANPFDFNYGPVSTTPTQATALSLSKIGLLGDSVTALIPYTDDTLIVGADHNIYLVRGDPMSGGQADLVSDAIGIAYGQAWCKDPYGTVYFLSNRCGLYSFIPGQLPQRISQPIEPLLQNLDMGKYIFRLVWNDQYQGFHLFVTFVDQPQANTNYFFEWRTQAWEQDKFANNNFNPLCCCVFDGNTPTDRRVLIGCWDGFVRQIDPTAKDDDGYPIQSEVLIGPLLTKDFDEIKLKDLQAVMGETSGQVQYSVLVGSTAEAALARQPVATGTWGASRSGTVPINFAGHAIYIRLTSSNPWAMEAIRARIASQGKVRRRELR